MNPYTKLSNRVYPRAIRSSAALGKPSQRNEHSTGIPAAVVPASTSAKTTQRIGLLACHRQHTELRANQLEAGVQVCLQIHLSAGIRSTPSLEELTQGFHQPCHPQY